MIGMVTFKYNFWKAGNHFLSRYIEFNPINVTRNQVIDQFYKIKAIDKWLLMTKTFIKSNNFDYINQGFIYGSNLGVGKARSSLAVGYFSGSWIQWS